MNRKEVVTVELGGLKDRLEKIADYKDWAPMNLRSNAALLRTEAEMFRRKNAGFRRALGYELKGLSGPIIAVSTERAKKLRKWVDKRRAEEMAYLRKQEKTPKGGFKRYLAEDLEREADILERDARRIETGTGGGLRRFGRAFVGTAKDNLRELGARIRGEVPLIGLTEDRVRKIREYRKNLPL